MKMYVNCMQETPEQHLFTGLHMNDITIISSPFYKGALLWDNLHVDIRRCAGLTEFKKALKRVYYEYNDTIY